MIDKGIVGMGSGAQTLRPIQGEQKNCCRLIWSKISYLVGYLANACGGPRMAMVKKSISVTDQQDRWIKAQIQSGHFGNESEVVRELIRERQIREQETQADIEAIRSALIEGEQSGLSKRTPDQIMKAVIERKRNQ